jgi:HEPN domain-containing protein
MVFEERLTNLEADAVLDPDARDRITSDFPSLDMYCKHLGLLSTVDQFERILKAVNTEGCTCQNIRPLLPDLINRLEDDLKRAEFLYVPPDHMSFYRESPQFGHQVAAKFPKSVEDIQEAAKCFALGRYTSTVFHLMRVMEAAVQYLGKRMGITVTGVKNWANILDEVDKAIKSLPLSDRKQRGRRNRLAESSVHLRMVKDAWRNDVMHPKETYTEEEAERIFRNVKDFMVHLATKL